jgi:hypothetical protein
MLAEFVLPYRAREITLTYVPGMHRKVGSGGALPPFPTPHKSTLSAPIVRLGLCRWAASAISSVRSEGKGSGRSNLDPSRDGRGTQHVSGREVRYGQPVHALAHLPADEGQQQAEGVAVALAGVRARLRLVTMCSHRSHRPRAARSGMPSRRDACRAASSFQRTYPCARESRTRSRLHQAIAA